MSNEIKPFDMYDKKVLNNNDLIVKIPFLWKQFTNTAFFIIDHTDEKELLIPDRFYERIDKDTLLFNDPDNELKLTPESNLRFVFLHNRNKFHITKVEYHIKADNYIDTHDVVHNSRNTTAYEYELPDSPYYNTLNLNNRMLVFYNRQEIRTDINFHIDKELRRLWVYGPPLEPDPDYWFDIVCMYTGTEENYALQHLPQSGYFFLNRHEINRNYNNNLMAVFVNGELVPRDYIIAESNNAYKIQYDINTRYNLDVRNMSPKISSLVPFYKKMADPFDIPVQYWYEEIPFKFTVVGLKKNRKYFDTTFTTIYFDPRILEFPEYYISLVHRGTSHFSVEDYGTQYTIDFFRDDYVDEPEEVLVTIELGERQPVDYPNEESWSPLLFGTIPHRITNRSQDYSFCTTQIKSILKMDEYNTKRLALKKEVDVDNPDRAFKSIIGRMWIKFPRPANSIPYLYYEMDSSRYEDGSTVGIFEWVVSEFPDGEGKRIYIKHVNLIPSNKIESPFDSLYNNK